MRRSRSGAGCGACGCVSHTRTREAGGNRPWPLWASAFNGWTGKGERRRKPPGWTGRRGANRRQNVALARKCDPPDRKAAVARLMALRDLSFTLRKVEADRDLTTPAPIGRAAAPHLRVGITAKLGRSLIGANGINPARVRRENAEARLFEIRNRRST